MYNYLYQHLKLRIGTLALMAIGLFLLAMTYVWPEYRTGDPNAAFMGVSTRPQAQMASYSPSEANTSTPVPSDVSATRYQQKPAKKQTFREYASSQPNYKSRPYEDAPSNVSSKAVDRFPFDPNTATQDELVRLGVPERTAKAIVNYVGKGGKFRKKEDLQKIYTLTPETYQQLEPYIQIAALATNNERTYTPTPNTKKTMPTVRLDINQATAEDWQSLRGIGKVLSGRIVSFRDKLGGFSSVQQVGETYGLPDSTFQAIAPHLTPSDVFRKVAVNRATEEELKQHPYIKYRDAQALVRYREQHGAFRNAADVEKIIALSPETIARVTPYFSYD